MFSGWSSAASSGVDAITMSRSSFRILCTHLMIFLPLALSAGSVLKVRSYLFLKYRASLARKPASAFVTGEDQRPTVETVAKSTSYDMGGSLFGQKHSTGEGNATGSGETAPARGVFRLA